MTKKKKWKKYKVADNCVSADIPNHFHPIAFI